MPGLNPNVRVDQGQAASDSPFVVLRFAEEPGRAVIELGGSWRVRGDHPDTESLLAKIAADATLQHMAFDTHRLVEWDASLLAFVLKLSALAEERSIEINREGLPEGVRNLIRLAAAVPEKPKGKEQRPSSFLARLGSAALRGFHDRRELVTFVGEAAIALARFLAGRAQYRRVDLSLTIQTCGAEALPIVSLISFLVGLILAFVGAIQLQKFGAQIYVADLVGIAMAREMGAMMAAIIMAGRTGAAFAAQLGTMSVNEEIDALKTMGISPIEFLVLPRMVALALMMPLLCLYADLVGILGGAVVAVSMLDVSLSQYWHQTVEALTLTHFAVGLSKSAVFGVLIAVAGCLRGLQSGRSAAAVGDAATSAVVTAIVWIIVSDAVFAVLTNILNV